MPTLYRARHRRAIVTDSRPFHAGPAFDVQNDAACVAGGHKRVCAVNCARHNAVAYAEMYARHATDSIR